MMPEATEVQAHMPPSQKNAYRRNGGIVTPLQNAAFSYNFSLQKFSLLYSNHLTT